MSEPNNNDKKKPPPAAAQGGESKKTKKKAAAAPKQPPKEQRPWTDELQKDFDCILSVGEECISEKELKQLLLMKGRGNDKNMTFNLYDGFEPSGRMHIAQGVFKAVNVNKCTSSGGTFVFWVADWFALMNDKMGGDLKKIQIVGKYLIEVWKAAGMHLDNVVFKWASSEITNQAHIYWPLMLDVARRFNITRIKKCCQIMGRLEGSLTAAQVLYPLMQCTDVFFLKADICQLGVDQRKVNMLAREYCDACKKKYKPIVLSHHMLYGLKQGQEKMSKSDPDSAIFMEDKPDDVARKIRQAYCPRRQQKSVQTADDGMKEGDDANDDDDDAGKASMHLTQDDLKNPCLDYIQHIILSPQDSTFTAGNNRTYGTFQSVKSAFLDGELSEDDLKTGLIDELNKLLEPVRQHFTNDETARDLLAKVQQFKKETANQKSDALFRRLNLVALDKVPANAHLVVAPMPNANPTLQQAMNVLDQLRSSKDVSAPKVLLLQDWSALVCNACRGEAKGISAYYTILLKALDVLGDKDNSSMSFQVVRQSEAILADPSNYWISVINAGRHFMLDRVMKDPVVAIGSTGGLQDSDGVGFVIHRLMTVADVAGVAPASLAFCGGETNTLVQEFLADKQDLIVPDLTTVSGTSIRLQAERESEALQNPNDEYFLLDDPKVNGKSKLNKSFAEEKNVTFCPPLTLASVFCFGPNAPGQLVVKRSEQHGGDKTYENYEALVFDYQSGALHPGDLKAAMVPVMVGILDRLASGIKADKEAMQASKCLKNLLKKKK